MFDVLYILRYVYDFQVLHILCKSKTSLEVSYLIGIFFGCHLCVSIPQLAVRARFVLSPFPPLVVASMLKRAALRYDVGEKLSVVFDNLIQKMKL